MRLRKINFLLEEISKGMLPGTWPRLVNHDLSVRIKGTSSPGLSYTPECHDAYECYIESPWLSLRLTRRVQ
jgi:hypothetical protein